VALAKDAKVSVVASSPLHVRWLWRSPAKGSSLASQGQSKRRTSRPATPCSKEIGEDPPQLCTPSNPLREDRPCLIEHAAGGPARRGHQSG